MKKLIVLSVVLFVGHAFSFSQTRVPAPVVLIKAGRLVDVRAGRVLENQGILIEGERIKSVGPLATIQRNTPVNGPRRRPIDRHSSSRPRRLSHSHPVAGRHHLG